MKAILIYFFLTLPLFLIGQWETVFENPCCISAIRGTSFINDSTGYAVVQGGANNELGFFEYNIIMRTSDYAESWDTLFFHQVNCPCSNDSIYYFKDIFFLNENLGWVCASSTDSIWKTTNGGMSWEIIDTQFWENYTGEEYEPDFERVYFYNEEYGILLNTDGIISLETYDGGETWYPNDNLKGNDCQILAECNVMTVGSGWIGKEEDCVWTNESFPSVDEVPQRSGRHISAISSDSYILGAIGLSGFSNFSSIIKTSDGGQSYSILDFPFGQGTLCFEFVNDSVGFTSINSNLNSVEAVYKTFDSGVTWYGQITDGFSDGDFQYFTDIECPSENICYGSNAQSVHRTFNGGGDLGQIWTSMELQDENSDTELIAFPNPTGEKIKICSGSSQSYSLAIFDYLGSLVYFEEECKNNSEIDLSELSNGIFIIRVQIGAEATYLRITKI